MDRIRTSAAADGASPAPPERGQDEIAGVLRKIFIGLALAASTACHSKIESDARAGASPLATRVTVAEPIGAAVTETSEYTGRAEAVDSVDIRPRVAGQLQRAAFREGDLVKKGDLLFVIDPRPFQAVLDRAKGALERARVNVALAQRDAARAKELLQTKSIAEREWDTQNSAADQLTAESRIAAADVATAALDLEFAFVRAPVDGRIGRALVTAGNLVGPTAATALATLVSVDPLYVYVDVEEARVLRTVRPRASASAGTAAATESSRPSAGADHLIGRVGFAGEDGYPHEATMDFLDNRVDPATGTTKLRLIVPNPTGTLTPGLFARVRLPEGDAHSTLLISDHAVGTDQDRKYVYVVDRDDKVQYRAVKLGPSHQGLRIVRDGLSPTDRVVVRGLQRVRPGAPVRPESVSMASVDQPAGAPGAER